MRTVLACVALALSPLGAPLEAVSQDQNPRRPQDPVEPFPYLSEDVRYPNSAGGNTLAGTFTRPSSEGPFPAVILIAGSGRADRNEALMGHRPFLVLSDHLTRQGIAVLRFDKRGVGDSTGDFAAATSQDFASDVLAGVAYLKTRDDVDVEAIGLAGHSEGGLIGPMAAVASEDVSFLVLMAGPGVNGERILQGQRVLIARASEVPEAVIARSQALLGAVLQVLKSGTDTERNREAIARIVRGGLQGAGTEDRARLGITDEASLERVVAAQLQQLQVEQLNTPWFRYLLTYEPAETIAQVTVPVLAINGENDLLVPYEKNLDANEAALVRGGNADFEIHALPGLNHLFQTSETGAPSEFRTIEETWSVDAMELIAEWVLRTVERRD